MFGRTYFCEEVTEKAIGETVTLKGWVQKRRDLGGLIFIDLRDRTGLVQIVFNPKVSPEALSIAEKVRTEYVLDVKGTVLARDQRSVNENLKTGTIEVQVEELTIINEAKTTPFMIEDKTNVSEDVRLKYHYHVIRENSQAAVLLELGYLSNPAEEMLVNTQHYQEAVTTGIFEGLARYFKNK